jgi:hypothetical protein
VDQKKKRHQTLSPVRSTKASRALLKMKTEARKQGSKAMMEKAKQQAHRNLRMQGARHSAGGSKLGTVVSRAGRSVRAELAHPQKQKERSKHGSQHGSQHGETTEGPARSTNNPLPMALSTPPPPPPPPPPTPPTPPIRTMSTHGSPKSVSLSVEPTSGPMQPTRGWQIMRDKGLAVFGIR